MYDKFEAFQQLDKQDFGFMPNRYEIWQGGQMVGNGNTTNPIMAKVMNIDGEEKVVVTFMDDNLNNHLAHQNIYDLFVTSSDRLQLVTVPEQSNGSNNMAIQLFKMNIGVTRSFKNFSANEPFCCNLFILNGAIDKITFSFTNPEKLIEFYSDGTKEESPQMLDFEFVSSDHIRYENKRHVSGPHGSANRLVKVQPDQNNQNYLVSLFNLDGDHPVWQNNVQMAAKQMKIIAVDEEEDIIELRGYGHDQFGTSFADYGLTIHFDDGTVSKCVLHMHDRGVEIEYLG